MLTLRAVTLAQIRLALDYMMERRTLISAIVMVLLTGLFVIGNGIPAIRISDSPDPAGGGRDVSIVFVGDIVGDLAPGMVGLCTAFFIACLYGFLSAFRVWRDAPPRRRGYHWTLPVERSRHDLIRVVAGGVPLTAMVLILALVAALCMALGGNASTLPLVPAEFWIAFMIVPPCIYLLNTIPVLRSDRPAMPIAVALGGLYCLLFMSMVPGAGALFRLVRALVIGPYSLTVAVAGPVIEMIGKGLPAEQARRIAGIGLNTAAWPAAIILWSTLALAGVIVAVSMRPRKS